MSKLPSVSARECLRALQRGGFVVKRQTGSHMIVAHQDDPSRYTVVPNHDPVPPGTLRSILRDLELSVDEFIELLHQ